MTFKYNHSLMFIIFLAAGLIVSGASKAQPADDPVFISGQSKIVVDAGNNGPDEEDPYYNVFYNPSEDCIYAVGNGVEPFVGAYPVKLQSANTLQEIGSCGSEGNSRPPEKHVTGVLSNGPAEVGGGGNSSGQLINASNNGALPAVANGELDAVEGRLANGLQFLADSNMLFWPNTDNPTHIVIPYAGLRPLGRTEVYVPLTDQKKVVVTNSVTKAIFGSLDFVNGVTIGGQGGPTFTTMAILLPGQPAAAIPALGPWSVVLLMLALLGTFVFSMRRLDLPTVSR